MKGNFEIGSIDPRNILIRFSLHEDYVKIWLKDATLIEENLFRFFKWFPAFVPGIEPPVVPVWVSLPGLPLNFFKKPYLELLVKPIGKVLAFDQATLSLARPGVARVCVEVNLLANNPTRIWLDMGDGNARWQKIVYERSKKFCKSCRKQGHGEDDCRRKVNLNKEAASGGVVSEENKDINVESRSKARNKGKSEQHIQNARKQIQKGKAKMQEFPNPFNVVQSSKGIWIQIQKNKEIAAVDSQEKSEILLQ